MQIGQSTALAAIHAAWADDEPIIYTQAGVELAPILAIRSEEDPPEFDGRSGTSLRKITYEIRQADLPGKPSKTHDSFTHRGRRWKISQEKRRDDIDAWQLIVTDAGAA